MTRYELQQRIGDDWETLVELVKFETADALLWEYRRKDWVSTFRVVRVTL